MKRMLFMINHPVDAFQENNSRSSWLLVIVTILIVTVFNPILSVIENPSARIDVMSILSLSIMGIISYLIECIAFWIVSKLFGSKVLIKDYITSWGLSFFPNVLCAVVVTVTEVYYYVFWNSLIWAMLLNIVYDMILIWKVILFVIYLKEVAMLRHGKLVGAFFIMVIIIIPMAMLNGFVGLKIPIL